MPVCGSSAPCHHAQHHRADAEGVWCGVGLMCCGGGQGEVARHAGAGLEKDLEEANAKLQAAKKEIADQVGERGVGLCVRVWRE